MTTAEEENASKVSKGPGVGLRSDLQELLDRCKGKLSHAQALDVVRFLHKCRHFFAPWNFVLGRTAVVKQRINTGPTGTLSNKEREEYYCIYYKKLINR